MIDEFDPYILREMGLSETNEALHPAETFLNGPHLYSASIQSLL